MEKVLVIGCPGGGKSTFSRALNKITGIPLFYLDMIWHKPDKTTCSREVFDQRLGEILRGERWIIDGNYARTLPLRLADCDTVFWLDYPLETCIEGMEEDEEFMEFVRNFPLSGRREIQRLLKEYPEKDIVVFYSREEAEAFLARQKKD